MRQAQKKHITTLHEWVTAALVGWLVCAIARVALAVIISVLSAGLLFWMQPEQIGSINWLYLRLLSPLGWLPFLLWGGLTGMAVWHFRGATSRRRRAVVETVCLLMLFAHESLWTLGTGYRFSLNVSRFLLVFSAEFWEQTWPLVTVWFLVFGTAFYLMPMWLRYLHEPIRLRLFEHQGGSLR